MSYIVLTGSWCSNSVLNVHAPSEDKSDDSKDSFYEEMEQGFFYHFLRYHMQILLGDSKAKGGERIFKPTIGNESLRQDSSENGFRIVNSAISKNLVVKMFPHRNIHQYTWIYPDGKIHNQIDHILVDMRWHSIILDVRSVRGLTVILITIWWLQKSGTE